jgi:xanthine dehydrogenase iron-sulfur cluster and FAD-binding subunit A
VLRCELCLDLAPVLDLALRAAHPEAWLLAGGTDLGLRFSEHREHPAQVICLLNVAELQRLEPGAAGWRIGAAVSYARLLAEVEREPDFAGMREYLARLGSRQIRGLGSIGGNLGTASPIGDALPVLLALDATVTLASTRSERVLPVAEFLLGYRRNALAADEIIREVFLPRPASGAIAPISVRSSVVLPAPLRPASSTNSPGRSANDTPSSTDCAPRRSRRSAATRPFTVPPRGDGAPAARGSRARRAAP